MPSNKPRVTFYVTDKNYARVKALAARPGQNVSKIVETALTAFFSHEAEDRRDGAIIRRLDRLTRQLEVNKRNMIILSETVALNARYFLTLMPEVDKDDMAAVQAMGARRYEKFIKNWLSKFQSDTDFRVSTTCFIKILIPAISQGATISMYTVIC